MNLDALKAAHALKLENEAASTLDLWRERLAESPHEFRPYSYATNDKDDAYACVFAAYLEPAQ